MAGSSVMRFAQNVFRADVYRSPGLVKLEQRLKGGGLHLSLTRIVNRSENVGQRSKSIWQPWSLMGLGRGEGDVS